jgi:hypothetical protein
MARQHLAQPVTAQIHGISRFCSPQLIFFISGVFMKKLKPTQLAMLISLAFSSPFVMAQQATDVGKINVEGLPGATDSGLITQEESPKARSAVNRAYLDKLNPSIVLKYSETADLDPYSVSGVVSFALLEELMATASIIGRA